MADLQRLENMIHALRVAFQRTPFAYFSERELHGEFFGLCRNEFGDAMPNGESFAIPLFRCEYNTIWRYRRAETAGAFSTRSSAKGRDTKPGSIDFAILRRQFVECNDLPTVINKCESFRASLRTDGKTSMAVDAGIEFKMVHVREAKKLAVRADNYLIEGLVEDARKLAHEWPSTSYLLGFSHGTSFSNADKGMDTIHAEFKRLCPEGDLRIMIVAGADVHQKGDWMVRAANTP